MLCGHQKTEKDKTSHLFGKHQQQGQQKLNVKRLLTFWADFTNRKTCLSSLTETIGEILESYGEVKYLTGCACVCLFVYAYAYMYMQVYMYVHACLCVHTCMCIHAYKYVCVISVHRYKVNTKAHAA